MIKRNILKSIVSSVAILLPMLFGVIMWDSLPDVIATHFGPGGEPDGFAGKAFAVFVIPAIMLALHWVFIITTAIMDARGKGQNNKIYSILFFICPMLSIVCATFIYSVALGGKLYLGVFGAIAFGVMFILIGNYMPKATRNRYFGIKIKWTLDSEENWTATHRFAGRVWFFGGFAVMVTAILPEGVMIPVFLSMIFILVFAPMIYSYVFYRKKLASGEITSDGGSLIKSIDKKLGIGSVFGVVIVLAIVAVLMFTGNITATVGEDALTVGSTYYEESVIRYEDIDSIEYRETGDLGARQYGYGSAKLSLGIFKNAEFGNYTRYTYTSPDAYIIIKSGEKTLVIGLASDAETKALYEEILLKIGE